MPPETSLRPTETWLVCPSTLEQTDQYWQAVSMCRAMAIELELHPLVHSCELPWKRVPNFSRNHCLATAPAAAAGAVRRAEERPPPRGSRMPYF